MKCEWWIPSPWLLPWPYDVIMAILAAFMLVGVFVVIAQVWIRIEWK